MKKEFGFILGGFMMIMLMTQEKICRHLGVEDFKATIISRQIIEGYDVSKTNTSESLFRWDEKKYSWIPATLANPKQEPPIQYAKMANFSFSENEPKKIKWDLLLDIDFNLKHNPDMGASVYVPEFSTEVKALDGKEILIDGFIIPLDGKGENIALSANPYSSCFFCGGGSPASVMTIFLQEEGRKFRTDQFETFRGTLKLNYDDPLEFYYILEDARIE